MVCGVTRKHLSTPMFPLPTTHVATTAHFQVRTRWVPHHVRTKLSPSVRGWYFGTILRICRVTVGQLDHVVASVHLYNASTDPKTKLPWVTRSGCVQTWIAVARLGPVVALGYGAPGVVGKGSGLWTVLQCTLSTAHCTPDACVCPPAATKGNSNNTDSPWPCSQ